MKQTLRGRRPSRLGAHQGGSVRRLGLHYVLLTFALTFSCYCINTSTAQDATTDRPTATATATPTATAVAPTLKPDIEFYSGVNGVGSSYFVNVNVTTSVESVYYRVSASSNAPCPSSSSSSTLFSNVMFQNLPFVPKSIRVNIQKYQIILYGWYANNGDHICGPSWTLLNYDSNGNPSTGLFNINSWIVDNTAYSGVWKISPIQEKPTTQIPTTLPPTTQTPTTATPTTQIPTTLPPTTQTPTTLPPTTLPPTNTPTTLPTTTRVVVLDFTLRSLRTDKSQCGWYGVYWPTDTGYVTIQYDTQTGSLSFPRFHWSIAERDQCNTPSIAASPVQLWLYAPSGSTPLNTTAGQCIQTLKNGIRNNANQDVEVSTCSIKQEYRQEFLLKAQKKQITFCIINKDLNTCILDSQQTTYIQDQCSTNNGGCHPLSTCTTAANGTAICGSIPTTETPTTPAPTTIPPTNAPKPDIEFYSGVNGIGSSYFMNVNVTTSGDVYYRVSAPSNAPCPSSSSTSSLFSNVMFQNLPFVPKSIRVNIQKYQIILYGWYNNNGDNICGPSWTLLNYDNNGNPSTGLFNINSWIVDYTAYSGVWKISTIQEKPTTQIPTTLTPTTQTPTTLPPTTQPATTRVVILDFTLRSLRTNKAECGWYGVYWPTDTGYATIKYDTQTGSLSFPRLHWSIAERDQCNTPSIPASSVVFGLNGLSDNNSGLALNTTNGQCIQTLVNGIRNNANQDAIVSTCTIKPEYRQEFLLKAQQKQISFCIINKELNTCILNSQQTTYIQDQCSTNNGGCHPLSTCTTAPNGTAICAVPKPTEPMKFNDYGYPYRTRGWFDVQGLGKALDYCRYVGTGDIWFSCALAGGTFEYTAPGVIIEKRVINIPRPNPLPPATGPALATVSDRGLPDLTRVEVDLFGRGEAWDYCRMVSNTSNPQFIWFSCVFAGYQGKEIYTKPGEILITAEYAPTTLPPTTQAPTSAVDPCTADSVKPYLPGRIYQPLSVYECCSYEGYKWCAIYYTSNPPSENTNGQFGPWRKIAACAGTTTTRPPTTTTPTPTPTPTPTITRPPPTTQAPSTAAPTTATPTTAAPTIVTPTAPVPTSFNWTSVTERTWTHPFQSSISFVYNNPPRNTPLYVRVQGRSTLITQGTTSSSIQVSANVNLKGNQQLTSMTVEILRDDQDGIPIAADHIYTQVVTRSAISRVALPDPILNAMANGQDAAMSSQPCPSSANTGAIVGGVVAAMTVLIILTNIATHVITKRHQPKVQSKPVAENWNVNPVTTEGVVVVV